MYIWLYKTVYYIWSILYMDISRIYICLIYGPYMEFISGPYKKKIIKPYMGFLYGL